MDNDGYGFWRIHEEKDSSTQHYQGTGQSKHSQAVIGTMNSSSFEFHWGNLQPGPVTEAALASGEQVNSRFVYETYFQGNAQAQSAGICHAICSTDTTYRTGRLLNAHEFVRVEWCTYFGWIQANSKSLHLSGSGGMRPFPQKALVAIQTWDRDGQGRDQKQIFPGLSQDLHANDFLDIKKTHVFLIMGFLYKVTDYPQFQSCRDLDVSSLKTLLRWAIFYLCSLRLPAMLQALITCEKWITVAGFAQAPLGPVLIIAGEGSADLLGTLL